MSEQTIQTKIELIRNETQQYANTRGRVADTLTLLNTEKLDREGVLEVVEEITNIAPEFFEYIETGVIVGQGLTQMTQPEAYTSLSGDERILSKFLGYKNPDGTDNPLDSAEIGKYLAAAGGYTADKELALNIKAEKGDDGADGENRIKVEIDPVYVDNTAYTATGDITSSPDVSKTTLFNVEDFAGNSIFFSNVIPTGWGEKSMIISQTGVITLFGGSTNGEPLELQLPGDAKEIKLTQYYTFGETTIHAVKNGFTVSFDDFEALKDDYYSFKDLDSTNAPVVNFFDKDTMVLNQKYIDPSTGEVKNAGNTDERVVRIPVTPGLHAVNINSLPVNFDKVVIETNVGVVSDILNYNDLLYDQTGQGRVLNILEPEAKYILLQVSITGSDFRNTLQVQKGDFVSDYEPYKRRIVSIAGLENNADYTGLFKSITDYIKIINPMYGKKLGVIGDSISHGFGLPVNQRYNYKNSYAVQMAERNNMTLNIEALTGSFLAVLPSGETGDEFVNRMVNIDSNCDYITIFGGTNDVNVSTPIGVESDTVNTTILGALNIICSYLIDKAPTAKKVLVTPLNYTDNARLPQIVQAIKTIGAKYSIPVLDLYNGGNYSARIASQLAAYAVGGNDIFHPNELYNALLSWKVEQILKS